MKVINKINKNWGNLSLCLWGIGSSIVISFVPGTFGPSQWFIISMVYLLTILYAKKTYKE
jgi:hypothetical protein